MRKTAEFIGAEGRDKGRRYVITELPALQAEWWASRALMALARSGVDIGPLSSMGMAGIASAGMMSLMYMDSREAKPLLDEMLACVQIAPDAGRPTYLRPLTGDDDVEEIKTLVELRRAIFDLHTSFLQSAAPSAQTAPETPAGEKSPTSIRRTRPARSP